VYFHMYYLFSHIIPFTIYAFTINKLQFHKVAIIGLEISFKVANSVQHLILPTATDYPLPTPHYL